MSRERKVALAATLVVEAWLVAALAIVMTGCGAECDYTTPHGLCVDDATGDVESGEVESSELALLMVAGGTGRWLYGHMLYVEGQPLPLDGADGPCRYQAVDEAGPTGKCAGGLTYHDQGYTRVWLDTPCFARTAFVHELCHSLQFERDGVIDDMHTDPKVVENAGGDDSYERRAEFLAIINQCPEER